MTTRDTPWPAGTPCWFDISVPDVDAALAFYGPVLGWSFVDSGEDFGHYRMCQVDGRSAAGIGPMQSAEQPTAWLVYLASDDADGTAKLITNNGGTVVVEPFDIGDIGRIAVALDSTGGAFGVFQSNQMVGMEVVDEPGGVVWEDSRLVDAAAGKKFYSAVFGYTYQAVPGAPDHYGMFMVGERPGGGMGGMMGEPEGTPSHWVVYFTVADAGAALDTVQRGGGSVVRAAEDTPFGRIATVADPFGAVFGLHSPIAES